MSTAAARTWRTLYELLTGADLTDPRCPLAFTNRQDKSRYLGFTDTLTTPLRAARPRRWHPGPARHQRAPHLGTARQLLRGHHAARPRPRRHRPGRRHPARRHRRHPARHSRRAAGHHHQPRPPRAGESPPPLPRMGAVHPASRLAEMARPGTHPAHPRVLQPRVPNSAETPPPDRGRDGHPQHPPVRPGP
jgi:hypothetical protein